MHTVFMRFTNTWCMCIELFRVRVHVFGVTDVYRFFIPCFCQCLSVSFTVDSMIQGNHIYKAIWDSHLGEELVCRRERNNIPDPFAVAVLKSDVIVGHVPRAISAVCYVQYNQLQLIR